MNQILDPLLLKDTASRGQVALVYGIAGLLVGVLFFNATSSSS